MKKIVLILSVLMLLGSTSLCANAGDDINQGQGYPGGFNPSNGGNMGPNGPGAPGGYHGPQNFSGNSMGSSVRSTSSSSSSSSSSNAAHHNAPYGYYDAKGGYFIK